MDGEAREAREAVRRLGRRGRTSRVPEAVRERVLRYARGARAQGRSWREIAGRVGLSSTALQRWAAAAPPPRRLKPVVVAPVVPPPAQAGGITLVTPGGYRLEGLGVEAAAVLLRALS